MSSTTEKVIALLKSNLSENRFKHSMNVADCAKELAIRFNCDENKAYLTGLLHDCSTKYNSDEMIALARKIRLKTTEEELKNPVSSLHAALSAYIAERDYGVHDKEILQAIAYHSSGGINMTALDKIIGLADAIEPSRTGSEIDNIRVIAKNDLNEAYFAKHIFYMINAIRNQIYLSDVKVNVYNYLVSEKEQKPTKP